MKTNIMLGLEARGDTGDSVLLRNTKLLLDAGTPGPVVNALLDDLMDPAFRVVEQAGWDKLQKELILARENARTEFLALRGKHLRELESLFGKVDLVGKRMANAIENLEESQKANRAKKGGPGYYKTQAHSRLIAGIALANLVSTLRGLNDTVLTELAEMAYPRPNDPSSATAGPKRHD